MKGAIEMSDFAIEDLKPETSLCSLRIEGPVAHLTLTREDVYNALNIQLISEIIAVLDLDQGAFRRRARIVA